MSWPSLIGAFLIWMAKGFEGNIWEIEEKNKLSVFVGLIFLGAVIGILIFNF